MTEASAKIERYLTDSEKNLRLELIFVGRESLKVKQFIAKQLTKTTDGKESLKQSEINVKLGEHRQKRSLEANSYAWVLMDKIAKVLNSTKEDIYRQLVSRVGPFEIVPVKEKGAERFKEAWESRGLGWVVEITDSKLTGYKNLVTYFGSSTYDKSEMKRLIDEIVSECKELDIETRTPVEIAELISLWGEYERKD